MARWLRSGEVVVLSPTGGDLSAATRRSILGGTALWSGPRDVVQLAHQDCSTTGEVFTVGGGHVSRFFLARTRGYSGGSALTPEAVRDHWEDIRDEDGYTVPTCTGDESETLFAAIARASRD